MEGFFFNDWMQKLEGNTVARIVAETREAKILSESLRQTAKRLQNALDIGRKSAEGLAHNALATMANYAEREYYRENSNQIKALIFECEHDKNTTELCISLDQR